MTRESSVLMLVTSHGDVNGLPTTGIWFTEFSEPYEAFVNAGCRVTVASPRGGPAPIDPRGYPAVEAIADQLDALARLNATLPVRSISHDAFDGIFLPGGHGPMFDTAEDPVVKKLVAAFWQAGKVVGSVCHGPAGLLDVVLEGGVTLLKGKRVTGFTRGEDAEDPLFRSMPFSLQERMTREGAFFIEGRAHDAHVERDGRLVTGQNPASARITSEVFLEALREARSL